MSSPTPGPKELQLTIPLQRNVLQQMVHQQLFAQTLPTLTLLGFHSQVSAEMWTSVIILICNQSFTAPAHGGAVQDAPGAAPTSLLELKVSELAQHKTSCASSPVPDTPPPSPSCEIKVNSCQKYFLTKSYASLFCEMYFSPPASGNMHHLISQIDFQFSPIISLSNI